MRVGIIALQHESNTFLAAPTTIENFRQGHLLEGEAIRATYANAHHEVGGFFAGLDAAGLAAVPIFAAWAIPSGTITAATGEELVGRLFASLDAAGPLDGLLVAPHGAAVCEAQRDFDGHWLALVRARVGASVPIIGTLDPHGNVSQRMVDACQALIAYRTNPHLDQRQRGLEAAALMARTLRGEIWPELSAALPPLAINIERQHTESSPCRELYRFVDAQGAGLTGVLSASVILGFPYADTEEMGSGILVVTHGDRDNGRRAADTMAAYLWQHRHDFVGQLTSIDEALRQAAATPGTVGLLDMGDNVGGGSPADSTGLFDAVVRAGLGPALVCLYDPAAAAAAIAGGPSSRFHMSVGGRTDPATGAPFVARGAVESVHDGKFCEDEPRHGGQSHYDMGLTAIVRTDQGHVVMLTSRRMVPFSLAQLTSCGIDPETFRILVIKGVHAPVAAYQPVCTVLVRVNTPGATSADLRQFEYRHRRRPLFPFEADFEWPLGGGSA